MGLVENKDLSEILEDSQIAIDEMRKVFKEHEDMETVIVNPTSGVGKTLLIQTKKLIDLRKEINSLSLSIKALNVKLDRLLNLQESRQDKTENITDPAQTLEQILAKYDEALEVTAKKILNELKINSSDYKEVSKELERFKKATLFNYPNVQKYTFLFNRVRELLEEEKNDLPLTNRLEERL